MLLFLAAFGCSGEPDPAPAPPMGEPPAGAPPAGGPPPGPGGPGGPDGPGGPPEGAALLTNATISSAAVSLVQVKNGDAEVPATITGVTGALNFASGEAAGGELKIDVNTWASGDAGRDINVRTFFFKGADHPEATFTLESLENLPEKPLLAGTEASAVAKGTLSLYSGSVPVSASVNIARTETGYTLKTTEDFTVSIAALSLGENLAELIKVCAHESVDDSVRIGVDLSLTTE